MLNRSLRNRTDARTPQNANNETELERLNNPQQTKENIQHITNLVSFTESASHLDSTQYIELLNNFITHFDTQSITNILFNGLLNIKYNKCHYTEFLNENIKNILAQHQQQMNDDIHTNDLMYLHTDVITKICQFLDIIQLSKLEQCDRFLFKTIRKSPNCITSLNYRNWYKYFMSSQIININRLSAVKKLYFEGYDDCKKIISTNKYLIDSEDVFKQNRSYLRQICSNITHLTIGSAIAPRDYGDLTFKSLESIHFMNPTCVLSHIRNPSAFNLESLNVLIFYTFDASKLWENDCELTNFILGSKLKILSFRHPGRRRGGTSSTMCPSMDKYQDIDFPVYKTLQEYTCFTDFMAPFSELIYTKCEKLECLNLRTLEDKYFAEEFKIISPNLNKIALTNPSEDCDVVVKALSDNIKRELYFIDLLLWTKEMKETDVFNHLRDLLLEQLTKSDKLKELRFKMHSSLYDSDGNSNCGEISHRISSLYMTLFQVFNNKNTKIRKELKLEFNMQFPVEKEHQEKLNALGLKDIAEISWNFAYFQELLRILNETVDCCTFTFVIWCPGIDLKIDDFVALYDMDGWSVTYRNTRRYFNEYRITNIQYRSGKKINKLMNDCDDLYCDEEKRLMMENIEQNEDENVIIIDECDGMMNKN